MPRAFSLERVAGFSALACLVISILLLGKPAFSNASLPVRGITDPVIAIQAAHSTMDVDYVLGEAPSPDREVMRVKERIGFASLAAYLILFLALSALLLRSGALGRMLAPAAIVLALAAAGFGAAGNLSVLRLLDVNLFETTGKMINAIRSAAFAYWMLDSLTRLLLSLYFFRTPKLLWRLTGVLFAIAALMQFYGLRDGQYLVLASLPSGLALLLIAVIMLFPRRRNASTPALLFLLVAPTLHAQIKNIRTYDTHEPHGRGVAFDMSVAPNGDLLSFLAKQDGGWRLMRIRNWLDQRPEVESVAVPGPPGVSPAAGVSATLLITTEGPLAVAIATGPVRGDNGYDNVVSVIDSRNLSVLATVHQSGILEYSLDRNGGLVSVEADHAGRVPVTANQGAATVRLRFFALPGLMPSGSCQFSESRQAGAWIPHDADCGPSLRDILDGLNPPIFQEAAHRSHQFSPDGRYRGDDQVAFGHTFFEGALFIKEDHEDIYDTKSGNLIGTVKYTTRDSVISHFASLAGRDYLLVMEGGTKLKVYQIPELVPGTQSNTPPGR